MSGLALGLVLAAAGVHATWNRLLHGADDRLAAAAVGSVVAAVLLLPAVIAVPPVRVWPLAIASGAAEAAYFSFLAAAYRRGELSVTYPVARGIAPFLITLGGAAVLGQPLTAARVGGSLALAIGLAVISQAGLAKGRGLALIFAALTGVTIAVYSVIDAGAVRSANAVGYLGAVTIVQAVVLLGAVRLSSGRAWQISSLLRVRRAAPRGVVVVADSPTIGSSSALRSIPPDGRSRRHKSTRHALDRLRASVRAGAGIGVGSLAAYLLVLLAYQRAPASPVAALRELSILIGIFLARERSGIRVWAGGALCVLGAALTVV